MEGFPSVWWLWQHAVPNTVALMGATISERQASLILGYTTEATRVLVLTDGDDAGERAAGEVLQALVPHRWCRWHRLTGGLQPTDLDQEAIGSLSTSYI